MKLLKNHPLFSLLNSYLTYPPQPVNISYLWNFGSLLGACLVIQIIISKSTTDLSQFFFTLEEKDPCSSLDLRESLDLQSHLINLSLGGLFLNNNKRSNITGNLKISKYLNSFQFVKGLKHGLSLSTLPVKVEKYHKSMLGKIIRVLGGIAAYILLTVNSDFSLVDKESLNPSFFFFIASLGLSHLLYMSTIFSIRFIYVIYHIINGNWIHRNSPLKWIMSEGSGALLCFKGVCYISAIWAGAVGLASGLDEVIGEDYFKGLTVIKYPAHILKSSFELMDENISFGNKQFKLKNSLSPRDSEIIAKLSEYSELSKLKASITSNNSPEILEAFKEIKKELGQDLVADIDSRLKNVNPNKKF